MNRKHIALLSCIGAALVVALGVASWLAVAQLAATDEEKAGLESGLAAAGLGRLGVRSTHWKASFSIYPLPVKH